RVRDAGGPIFVTSYHGVWEWMPAAVAGMPGGAEWLERIGSDRPAGQHHLAVHEGHFTNVTDRDRSLLDAAGPALLDAGWTGTPDRLRERLAQAAAAGITDVLYTPAGADIPGEMIAFAAAAGG
ncbi:MAG TPA: hypothetical protein VGM78_10295, partial [Ilumatobacteraceae bacterium]